MLYLDVRSGADEKGCLCCSQEVGELKSFEIVVFSRLGENDMLLKLSFRRVLATFLNHKPVKKYNTFLKHRC